MNQIVFGPCTDEIAMPDSRRGACDLYYKIRRKPSPWAERKAALEEARYAPGELRCWRTLGGKTECEAEALRAVPVLAKPNNLGSE